MLLLLILIYLIILPGTILAMLYAIINKLETLIEKKEQPEPKHKSVLKKRTHTNIGRSNYNNVFNKRNDIQGYKKYTTDEGLYQPVMPHKPGINISKKEE